MKTATSEEVSKIIDRAPAMIKQALERNASLRRTLDCHVRDAQVEIRNLDERDARLRAIQVALDAAPGRRGHRGMMCELLCPPKPSQLW
jgi:hypothetical protein